jgi:hypothetical protein
MQSHTYVLEQSDHTAGFHMWRYTAAGLVLLCVALAGYLGIGVVKDFWLVKQAFPSLPAEFATDLDVSILFSPMMLHLNRPENSLLRWIKYPPLTIPGAPLPTGNPIGDEIFKAQKEQNLLNLGGILPLDEIMQLKQSSIEAVGRAIYLSQATPGASRSFERLGGPSTVDPDFVRESAVEQLRQIFAIAYGQRALQQATRPER